MYFIALVQLHYQRYVHAMNIKQPIMLKDQVMRNNRPQVCTISSFTVGTLETFF